MNYLKKRLKSFAYALAGIGAAFKSQAHIRLHVLSTVLVLILSFYFKIERWEWCIVLLTIGLVFSLEMINSAIEKLCDFVSEEKHEFIKYIKDVAAGAVLVAAIMAFFVGIIIFWERVYGIF